jgi:DNA-binding LytR/AlgR family response regulator
MPTALIAEDEPLLAANLQAELQRLWPELKIVASVGHGEAAVQQALALQPELLFLDIRMPGMTGLEAAQAIAEDWPDDSPRVFPLIVFVTAYDQYALQAFERAAVDYVLKPVLPDRLAQTCARLQAALQQRSQPPSGTGAGNGTPSLDDVMQQLRGLVAQGGVGTAAGAAPAQAGTLKVIQAGVGNAIHMVPVDEVLYFEAADKYVRVITVEREHLIRTSLRELQPQLDANRFWQIHRGTIVRCDAIGTALRDEAGKVTLTLREHGDKLSVSRMYAHLFKAM